MNWAGSNFAVIGAGVSGQAAVEVLLTLGANVTCYDGSAQAADVLGKEYGTRVGTAIHPDPVELAAAVVHGNHDVVVVSPGVPEISPLFTALAQTNIPLWGEVELAWQVQKHGHRPDTPWLAITGTNGKTTTVGMTAAILEAAGEKAIAVGNVGDPVVLAVAQGNYDALAVELSSFQLRTTSSMRPQAAVCLNLAPDHLDWHGDFAHYRDAKARVYANTEIACIYSEADPQTRDMVAEADVQEGARAIGITLAHPAPSQFGVVEDLLVDRAFLAQRHKHALEVASFADLAHLGGAVPSPAILSDALAAAALARAHGVAPAEVAAGLRAFRPAAHRRVTVGEAAQVTWVDDSKATNAHAAAASLAACPLGRAVWIAGGLAKGQDFSSLVQQVRDRLRGVVVIGVDREPILSALRQYAPGVPFVEVTPHEELMTSVIHEAVALSLPGDTVVLAPACASWDQFGSYGERGEAFSAAVAALDAV